MSSLPARPPSRSSHRRADEFAAAAAAPARAPARQLAAYGACYAAVESFESPRTEDVNIDGWLKSVYCPWRSTRSAEVQKSPAGVGFSCRYRDVRVSSVGFTGSKDDPPICCIG